MSPAESAGKTREGRKTPPVPVSLGNSGRQTAVRVNRIQFKRIERSPEQEASQEEPEIMPDVAVPEENQKDGPKKFIQRTPSGLRFQRLRQVQDVLLQ